MLTDQAFATLDRASLQLEALRAAIVYGCALSLILATQAMPMRMPAAPTTCSATAYTV